MNRAYRNEFSDNRFSRWLEASGAWQASESSAYSLEVKRIVPDIAELNLLDELIHAVQRLPEIKWGPGFDLINAGRDAILYIQGGIGCGKSTLVHHFSRITLPALKELCPYTFIPSFADINTFERTVPIESAWRTVVNGFREQVVSQIGISKPEHWRAIAQDEVVDQAGELRTEIAFEPDTDLKIREIIRASRDDTVLISRTARSIGRKTPRQVLLFVLDNLDFVPLDCQRAIVDHFVEFLQRVKYAIGIVTVREYTLGDLQSMVNVPAHYRANCMHITTPLISEMLDRRFSLALEQLDPEKAASGATIEIKPGITVSRVDLRQLFQYLARSFAVEDRSLTERSPQDLYDIQEGLLRPAVFLHYVTNSNMRAALEFLLTALTSWTLEHDRIIGDYYRFKETRKGFESVFPFTVDQLIRLASYGQYDMYHRANSGHLFNVYSMGDLPSNPHHHRSAALHVYRVLQTVASFGDKAIVQEILRRLECFNFSANENLRLLEKLLRRGFIESRFGSALELSSEVYCTRKLHFYTRILAKSLAYISAVRSDVFIDYPSQPRTVNSRFVDDFCEVLKFAEFICRQEQVEYGYVLQSEAARFSHFRAVVGSSPVCWGIVTSAVSHYRAVQNRGRLSLSAIDKRAVDDLFRTTRAHIAEASGSGKIYPRLPDSVFRLELGDVARP